MLRGHQKEPVKALAMENFFQRLERRSKDVDSLLCIGLDPHPSQLEDKSAAGAAAFCIRLIEETAAFAAAFKPNIAFFEAHGSDGTAALQRVIGAVPAGIPVLLDAKRGDIGSTAAAYAEASFSVLKVLPAMAINVCRLTVLSCAAGPRDHTEPVHGGGLAATISRRRHARVVHLVQNIQSWIERSSDLAGCRSSYRV